MICGDTYVDVYVAGFLILLSSNLHGRIGEHDNHETAFLQHVVRGRDLQHLIEVIQYNCARARRLCRVRTDVEVDREQRRRLAAFFEPELQPLLHRLDQRQACQLLARPDSVFTLCARPSNVCQT